MEKTLFALRALLYRPGEWEVWEWETGAARFIGTLAQCRRWIDRHGLEVTGEVVGGEIVAKVD